MYSPPLETNENPLLAGGSDSKDQAQATNLILNENVGTSSVTRSNSLLERIQQSKKIKSTARSISNTNIMENIESGDATRTIGISKQDQPSNAYNTSDFNTNMTEQNYSFAPPTVPQYSPIYQQHNPEYGNPESKIQSVWKNVSEKVIHSTNSFFSSGEKMESMNYQRESLLMDPHDEDPLAGPTIPINSASNFTINSNIPPNEQMGVTDVMLKSFTANSNNSRVSMDLGAEVEEYNMVGYMKQLLLDMKDMLLAAPRYVQGCILVMSILILWLLFV